MAAVRNSHNEPAIISLFCTNGAGTLVRGDGDWLGLSSGGAGRGRIVLALKPPQLATFPFPRHSLHRSG